MAAIAGVFGDRSDQTTLVERMLRTLEHRGPDSIKLHRQDGFCGGVAASRLSDDRGNGYAVDGTTCVLFDGEIYNRRRAGQSDADVALELFKRHGRTFASHLEGVFACAVYDGTDVLLARDRVGVRPVYWARTATGSFCFASELKALVGTATDVSELHPATTVSGVTGPASYLPHYPDTVVPTSFQEAASDLRKCVMAAVSRRLEDGAVGACLLSGGLDSSIIAGAARELGADIPLITVGLEGAPDVDNARTMAAHLGMEHHVFSFDIQRIVETVPKAVWALESFDEDCITGTIANLFASSSAAAFTNCILSGEGGDELFGGYLLLKDLASDTARLKMMERLIAIAYNTALQRLDRAMMANSIVYRTPFLDTHVISFALQTPVTWKIHDPGDGRLIEKHILREAFKDMLPEPIYRREKLRFSAGTGTDPAMEEYAREKGFDAGPADDASETREGFRLNSGKERWFYDEYKTRFPDPSFARLVGRWDPGK